MLEPGQPNAKYHSEGIQEDFLVLSGECLVILDGEERRLRARDTSSADEAYADWDSEYTETHLDWPPRG